MSKEEAATLAKGGNYDRALSILSDLHKRDPEDLEIRFLMGACHFKKNNLEEARRIWTKILETQPGHPKATQWLAKLGPMANPWVLDEAWSNPKGEMGVNQKETNDIGFTFESIESQSHETTRKTNLRPKSKKEGKWQTYEFIIVGVNVLCTLLLALSLSRNNDQSEKSLTDQLQVSISVALFLLSYLAFLKVLQLKAQRDGRNTSYLLLVGILCAPIGGWLSFLYLWPQSRKVSDTRNRSHSIWYDLLDVPVLGLVLKSAGRALYVVLGILAIMHGIVLIPTPIFFLGFAFIKVGYRGILKGLSSDLFEAF